MRFAVSKVGSGGKVCIRTTAAAHVVADVQGWYAGATSFTPVVPQRVLADTHYATKKDIVAFAAQRIAVYTPVPPDKADANAETQRKRAWQRRREPDAIKAWRQRMAEEHGKTVYQRRSRIETVNGILKGRGLGIMRVRSLAKVTCVVLLQALAHNLWRAHRLQASAA